MNTVLTITLIIALCIAIVLDIIRVVQYRAVNKMNRPRAIREFVRKVMMLRTQWNALWNKYMVNDDFECWCVEHWDDDIKRQNHDHH